MPRTPAHADRSPAHADDLEAARDAAASDAHASTSLPAVARDRTGILEAQRLLGNRTVSHLLRQGPPALRAPASASTRIQRAVGLELEVQNTHLWTGPEDPEVDGERNKLDYGTAVLSSDLGYEVESDDGRFEVVTKAFPETQEGRGKLIGAVGHAASLLWAAQELGREARKEERSKGSATLEELSNLSDMSSTYAGKETPWVGNFPDPDDFPDNPRTLWAKPQASIGIPLDRLAALAEEMRSTEARPGQKGAGFAGGVTPSNLKVGQPDRGRNEESSWGQQFEAVRSKRALEVLTNPASRNLAALIIHYLKEADDQDWIAYPKARHLVMARTNFATMFAPVSGQWPAAPGNGTWPEWFARQAGRRNADEFVYPGGYFTDSIPKELFESVLHLNMGREIIDLPDPEAEAKVDEAEAKVDPKRPDDFEDYPNLWNAVKRHFEQGPRIREWVASISPVLGVGGQPGGRVAPHLPGTPTDRGLGAWSKQDRTQSRPNRDAELKQVDAPVFELRLFKDVYDPETWTALAAHVFDLTRWVNSQRGPGSK